VVVSEASELFSTSSKRLAPSSTVQERMLLAARSLTAMKHAPPAPPTPILQREPVSSDLAPFTVIHSSSADFSPTTRKDSLELTIVPMSPASARKVYKAAKKTRSVTQIILKDSGSFAGANTLASYEVAGVAMPPHGL
jgi:hypothetical protein